MSIAAFASLLLAAGGFSMTDGKSVDAFVAQIYAPYHGAAGQAYWDRAIYTTPTRQLIEAWKAGRRRGTDDVSDADRLCGCQDWDAASFHVDVVTRTFPGPGRAVVLLRVWPVSGQSSNVRLALVREGNLWRIEDVGDAANGRSLTVALRRNLRPATRGGATR